MRAPALLLPRPAARRRRGRRIFPVFRTAAVLLLLVGGRAAEIRTRQKVIRTDLDGYEQRLNGEEELSEEQVTEIQDRSQILLDEFDTLDEELAPLAERETRLAAVRARMDEEAANRESGQGTGEGGGNQGGGTGAAGGGAGRPGGGGRGSGPDYHFRTIRNPYENMPGIRSGLVPDAEVRARAKYVIDEFAARSDEWRMPDGYAEEATRKVERSPRKFSSLISRHMLITGTPEYLTAWEEYVEDPVAMQARAALSLTPANGGYLVPFTLDPTIILTNAGSANPWRQYATVKTTVTNDWNGVTSAGVNAEWTAEGTEAADASPTVGQLKITPQKADAYLFGSFEVLSDSDFATQLPELFNDAKDRIEETSFAVGTGTGQPKGAITAGTVYAPAGSAAGPRIADVYGLQALLPARWRGPGSQVIWVAALPTINAERQLPKFTGSTQSLVDDTTDPPRLLGKPLIESTSIVSAFANGNKVQAYLDARQYYIVDRIGMSVIYDPVVLGANRRPTGQGAWYGFWRVGGDVSTATAVRVLSLTT